MHLEINRSSQLNQLESTDNIRFQVIKCFFLQNLWSYALTLEIQKREHIKLKSSLVILITSRCLLNWSPTPIPNHSPACPYCSNYV